MLPGSRVICIRDNIPTGAQGLCGAKPVLKDHIDVIRDINMYRGEGVGLLLEGVKNPINPSIMKEFSYPIRSFRELEPPPILSNFIPEEILEGETNVKQLEEII